MNGNINEAVKFVFDADTQSGNDNRIKSYIMLVLIASMLSKKKDGLLSDDNIQGTFRDKCSYLDYEENRMGASAIEWKKIRSFIKMYNPSKFDDAFMQLQDEGLIDMKEKGSYNHITLSKKGRSLIEPKYKQYVAQKEDSFY